ncbi:MAG TPA: hypothetical protein VFB45_26630 [Pseudolabrys sp.]|nr:hypothetical protein [Pseudolabrys sp.]
MSLFRKDVAMTHARHQKDFDLNHLLHPASAFRTPMEVVADPDMTVQEKRAILASWASDACAVEATPELRQPTPTTFVRFDEIMDALRQLDGQAASQPSYAKLIDRAQRWKDLFYSEARPARFAPAASKQKRPRRAKWRHPSRRGDVGDDEPAPV